VADVITLTNLFPLWIAIFSWPLLGEMPPLRVWLAIAMGVIGVVLVQQPHVAGGDFGIMAALVSSFFSALAMLGLNRIKGIDSRAIVFHFSFVALLFCSVALLIAPASAAPPKWSGINLFCLGGVGLFATIGQILLTKAFTVGNPAKVGVVGLSQVGFGMLYDVMVWHEKFDGMAIFGMVLVLAPTAWCLLASRTPVASR
jgi:drug/metabolite transporter (DMT)-like permease